MKPVEIAFLFTGTEKPDLGSFAAGLNARLKPLRITLAPGAPGTETNIALFGASVRLMLSSKALPLPADNFTHALESPLARPARGILADILFRHRRHIVLSVRHKPASEGDANGNHGAMLVTLKVAHLAATLLTERHAPAALHWRLSNQLLTARQYLKLSGEAIPWALLAHARIVTASRAAGAAGARGLLLEDATGLLDRPVLFHDCDRPVEEMHAAALSFLRHAIEHRAPIPDGHTFGPKGGEMVEVRHLAPDPGLPHGRYDLSAVSVQADDLAFAEPPSAEAPGELAEPETAETGALQRSREKNRIRSLAVSILMLAVMPPVGAALMLSNALFGSSTWRTSLLAIAAVTLALLLGAYTFMGAAGRQAALLFGYPAIQQQFLDE